MKKLLISVLASLSLLFFPFASLAAEPGTFDLDPCDENPLQICQHIDTGIGGIVGSSIEFLFVIAVVLSLGFLVYGGIKWITSGGDKGGIEAARNTIIAAIVGLVIVFLAFVILNTILRFLTGGDISTIEVPTL